MRIQPMYPKKKLITKTIHYVYGSGPKKGQTAAPDSNQNVIFWNKGHWNNESEKIIWDNPSSWTNPQNSMMLLLLIYQDTMVDRKVVTGQTVNHNSNNIEENRLL